MRKQGLESWLLIGNVSGHGYFVHPGGELLTQKGDLVLIPADARHDYGATTPYVRLYTSFQPRPEWYELLRWPEVAPGLMLLRIESEATRSKLFRIFKEAMHQAAASHYRARLLAMNALERFFLLCDMENPQSMASRLDSRIRHALDYCNREFSKPFDLALLSRRSGLSVSRFSFLFRQQTGSTPQKYLESCRLKRAAELLMLTSNPIKEIAQEVGFPDPFYFSARFKQHTGASPREFRQEHCK